MKTISFNIHPDLIDQLTGVDLSVISANLAIKDYNLSDVDVFISTAILFFSEEKPFDFSVNNEFSFLSNKNEGITKTFTTFSLLATMINSNLKIIKESNSAHNNISLINQDIFINTAIKWFLDEKVLKAFLASKRKTNPIDNIKLFNSFNNQIKA